MTVITHTNPLALWQEIVKQAEQECSLVLKEELETYLVSLLMRYINKPELVKQIIAITFLKAVSSSHQRHSSLQRIGDECLLFAGFFPQAAQKKLVKINYFVDLGQAAYAKISHYTNDVYAHLALQFVALMDVLQSIRADHVLLPLEAYEQWQQLGSQRSLRILQSYTRSFPLTKI